MISHYVIALLSPVFISFVLIVQLARKLKNSNDLSIKVLMSFMVLVFVLSITILIHESGYLNISRFLDSLKMSLMLVIHPLFYLYIKSLTINRIKWKTFAVHLMPACIVFLLASLFYLLLDKNEAIAYLSKYMLGEPSDSLIINYLYGLLLFSKYIHAAQVVVYFIWVYKLLRDHEVQVNHFFSTTDNYKLSWLFTFNFMYTFMSLMGAMSNLLPTRIVYSTNIFIEITMILFGLFTLYLGIKGMEQKSVGQIIDLNDHWDTTDEETNDLSNEFVVKKINRYIVEGKAFLNPGLKIWDIVENTGINRTYISQTINSEYNYNFNHYINKLWIETACNMLKENNHHCIESVAYECGFNSLPTFNRAFKRFTGTLPSKYGNTEMC